MGRIHIDTELARRAGERLIDHSQRLVECGRELYATMNGLDEQMWLGVSRARIGRLFARARTDLEACVARLDAFGERLLRVAEAFEWQDSVAVDHVRALPWLDWESTVPMGYVRAANVDSTSPKRIEDLIDILEDTRAGADVARWLTEHEVELTFDDLGTTGTYAYCSADGSRIVLDRRTASFSDLALAAVLAHEGRHSLDSHPFEPSLVGNFLNAWYNEQDDWMYWIYPFPEEYRAFRTQAEFWREVRGEAPSERFLDDVVDLIFVEGAGYRDVGSVYDRLHEQYHYTGLVNP